MSDMERTQRQDINDISDNRLTLAIDPLNLDSESHRINMDRWVGNNWLHIGNNLIKYNVVENDSLYFTNDALSQFLQKDITSVTLSFDYTVDGVVLVDSVSIVHDGISEYKNVERRIFGTGHIDIPCDMFGLDKGVMNTVISEQGFDIGIIFDGEKSNPSVSIRNVVMEFEYDNKLKSESDSVMNRIEPHFDLWNTEENVLLKIGNVEYSIGLSDLFGSAFYQYNLYANNYSPNINTTIQVICEVKDIFNNPVPNKELVLYYKGVAQNPVQTDITGSAIWNINVGATEGTFKITVNNQPIFINVIYDTGWVYGNGTNKWMNSHWLDYDSNNPIRVRRVGKVVHFEGTAKPNNALEGEGSVITIGTLPSQFRPNKVQRFIVQGSGKNTWLLSFDSNGTIGFSRYGTTTYITMPVNSWMNMYSTWIVG